MDEKQPKRPFYLPSNDRHTAYIWRIERRDAEANQTGVAAVLIVEEVVDQGVEADNRSLSNQFNIMVMVEEKEVLTLCMTMMMVWTMTTRKISDLTQIRQTYKLYAIKGMTNRHFLDVGL